MHIHTYVCVCVYLAVRTHNAGDAKAVSFQLNQLDRRIDSSADVPDTHTRLVTTLQGDTATLTPNLAKTNLCLLTSPVARYLPSGERQMQEIGFLIKEGGKKTRDRGDGKTELKP